MRPGMAYQRVPRIMHGTWIDRINSMPISGLKQPGIHSHCVSARFSSSTIALGDVPTLAPYSQGESARKQAINSSNWRPPFTYWVRGTGVWKLGTKKLLGTVYKEQFTSNWAWWVTTCNTSWGRVMGRELLIRPAVILLISLRLRGKRPWGCTD